MAKQTPQVSRSTQQLQVGGSNVIDIDPHWFGAASESQCSKFLEGSQGFKRRCLLHHVAVHRISEVAAALRKAGISAGDECEPLGVREVHRTHEHSLSNAKNGGVG